MSLRINIALAASASAFVMAAAAVLRPVPAPTPAPAPVSAPASAAVTPEAVRKALLERPEILAEVAQAFQRKQEDTQRTASVAQVEANRAALFADNALVLGNPNGKKVVAEFFDYQCGYCRAAAAEIKKLMASEPELKIVLREYPILGPASIQAAKAALAAGNQGLYPAMHEALLKQSNPLTDEKIAAAAEAAGVDLERLRADMERDEIKDRVNANMELGRALGINGTPGFAALGAGILPGFGGVAPFLDYLKAVAPQP